MEHLRLYNSFSIYVSPHSLGWNDVLNRFASNWCLMSIIDILWLSFGQCSAEHFEKHCPTARAKHREGSTFLVTLSICALCPVNVPTRDGERWGGRGGGGVNQHVRQRRGEEREGACARGTGKDCGVGRILKENCFVSFQWVLPPICNCTPSVLRLSFCWV